jgi:hypothetical protein
METQPENQKETAIIFLKAFKFQQIKSLAFFLSQFCRAAQRTSP